MTVDALPDPRWQRIVAAGLAFNAGFVDTCGFIALFGLFTAHVTGNFVVIGASLVDFRSGLVTKLLALPTFVVVVAVVHIVMGARSRAGKPNARSALLGQAVLLALFLTAGLAARPITHGDDPLAMLAGLLGVAAMAVQNAAARGPFKDLTPTTVMTGNTTQLVMDAVDVLRLRSSTGVAARFGKTWPVVLAFATGALGGAVSFEFASFWCLLLPIAILGILAQLIAAKGGAL